MSSETPDRDRPSNGLAQIGRVIGRAAGLFRGTLLSPKKAVKVGRSRRRRPPTEVPAPAWNLTLKERDLRREIAHGQVELDRLYGLVADGASSGHSGRDVDRVGLDRLIGRSRELKAELDEKRFALARVERTIERERLLRSRGARRRSDPGKSSVRQPRTGGQRTAAPRIQTNDKRPRAAQHAVQRASFRDHSQRLLFERAAHAMDDENPEVRASAAVRLGELGSPAAYQLLATALRDSSENVRVAALNSIAMLDTPESAALLQRYLGAESARLRLAAVRALAKVGGASSSSMLVRALEDEDACVRKAAATILGWREVTGAAASLVLCLRDEDARVRAAAAASLGSLGQDRAVLPLIRALDDERADVRDTAFIALREIVGDDIDRVAADEVGQARIDALKTWWRRARVDTAIRRDAGELVSSRPSVPAPRPLDAPTPRPVESRVARAPTPLRSAVVDAPPAPDAPSAPVAAAPTIASVTELPVSNKVPVAPVESVETEVEAEVEAEVEVEPEVEVKVEAKADGDFESPFEPEAATGAGVESPPEPEADADGAFESPFEPEADGDFESPFDAGADGDFEDPFGAEGDGGFESPFDDDPDDPAAVSTEESSSTNDGGYEDVWGE